MTRAKIIFYGVVCMAFMLSVVRCQMAQDAEKSARGEAKALADGLRDAEAENVQLRDILRRTNDAMNRAVLAAEEAQRIYDERIEKVHDDPDARDWLAQPVPASVCRLFDEDGHSDRDPAFCPARPVSEADGDDTDK